VRVLVSAAEASADLHAAQLVAAIRRRIPTLELMGIGGKHLEGEGLRPVARAADLAVMGSIDVLSRLPSIRRAGRDLLDAAASGRPDVAVLVDYPGFHFRIGPRLHAMGIPVIYFIPPKVWVWRKSRLQAMKAWVSRVLCILPFEPRIYEEAGIPAEFIGSPLIEELPVRTPHEEARAHFRLAPDVRALAVLPGSRRSEMKRHWDPFLDAAERFCQRAGGKWVVLVPIAPTLDEDQWSAKAESRRHRLPSTVEIRLITEGSGMALRGADLALVKSGTATLEAGVLECPMVVAYRPGKVTSLAVKHLLRYRGPVGLVNLFRGWKPGEEYLAPEVLHEEMTAERLSDELHALFSDRARLDRMKRGLRELRDEMMAGANGHGGPSDRAAESVIEVARSSSAVRSSAE
jgi:lipid-A-disaccharide synthase